MNVQTAPLPDFRDATSAGRGPREAGCPVATAEREELAAAEPVLSAAVLVASAFRLRDEGGLIATLRLLANAVASWEAQQTIEGAIA